MSDTHDQRITRGAEVLAEAMGRSNCGPRFDAAREGWERIVRAVLDAVSGPQEDRQADEAQRLHEGHIAGDCECAEPAWCLFEAGYKTALAELPADPEAQQ